uniref:Putative secreted protein n=1 Tax=Anopheles darlingi TaxID=43151 RepID=A0A2M4DI46_ANODA
MSLSLSLCCCCAPLFALVWRSLTWKLNYSYNSTSMRVLGGSPCINHRCCWFQMSLRSSIVLDLRLVKKTFSPLSCCALTSCPISFHLASDICPSRFGLFSRGREFLSPAAGFLSFRPTSAHAAPLIELDRQGFVSSNLLMLVLPLLRDDQRFPHSRQVNGIRALVRDMMGTKFLFVV